MILVAGLAIAGLAGIAAAFYFSVRPGNSSNERNSRLRVGGSGRTGASRTGASRTGTNRTGASRTGANRTGANRTGASRTGADRSPAGRGRTTTPRSRGDQTAGWSDPDDDFSEQPRRRADSGHLAAGHRVHRSGPSGQRADRPRPPRRADTLDWEEDTTAEEVQATRSRRLPGWRKGSEVDEELWPAAAFGGVSDEQFWDDMASDKPLATTARTAAQPDPVSRRRLPDVVPVPDRRDGDVNRIANGSSRPGLADRSGPQPVQTGPQPVQGSTQPAPVATRSYQQGTQPYQAATQPSAIAGHPGRAGLPADPRGRGRFVNGTDAGAAAGEDPLTSAAYSLRPPGAVDGRSFKSSRRSRDLSREQYEAAVSQETQSFSLAEAQSATAGYAGGVPPFRQFELPADAGSGRAPESRYDGPRSDPLRTDPYGYGGRPDPLRGPVTADAYGATGAHPYPERPYSDPVQPASAPPYADMYGYGYPVSSVDDPRQPNGSGTRGQGRNGGTGSWAARQAYPAGNGYRGQYDPRANGRG